MEIRSNTVSSFGTDVLYPGSVRYPILFLMTHVLQDHEHDHDRDFYMKQQNQTKRLNKQPVKIKKVSIYQCDSTF